MLAHTAQKSFMGTGISCHSWSSIGAVWILKLSRNRSCLRLNKRIERILWFYISTNTILISLIHIISLGCRLLLQITIFISRREGWLRKSFLESKRSRFKLLLQLLKLRFTFAELIQCAVYIVVNRIIRLHVEFRFLLRGNDRLSVGLRLLALLLV